MAFFRGLDMWSFLPVLILACLTGAHPLQNITLPLPLGTTNHNTPGLLCTPTQWTDIILFYLFNYVAHAATVLTRPGERPDDYMVSVVGSLLFPAMGLYRGIDAILSGIVFLKKHDDLRKAAKSGALCMVVRGNDWRPNEGDEIRNGVFRRANIEKHDIITEGSGKAPSMSKPGDEESTHILTYSPPWLNSKFGWPIYVHRQLIHGTYNLPEGYRFVIVPSDTHFTGPSSPNSIIEISATYSMVKALVALVQSGYAVLTLYRSRGDQISQFGYAAFGLTVAPYAVMSAMNLIGNLCRPDYASLYMVENSIMEEARKRGGVFEGSVGRVQEENMVVCGCGLADGDDAEDLRFCTDANGSITVEFGLASSPRLYNPPSKSERKMLDEPASACSSLSMPLTQHSHTVKPLPAKLDYKGTENDALLLVPCCNPIRRHSALSNPFDVPCRYRIEKLSLRRFFTSFKRRCWYLTFAPSVSSSRSFRWRFAKYFATAVIALMPLAINGIMSHFQPGSIPNRESSNWKTYTMQWLIMGAFIGIWLVLDQEGKEASPDQKANVGPALRAIIYFLSSSQALGGYIVVGQMLHRYGVCTWIGN